MTRTGREFLSRVEMVQLPSQFEPDADALGRLNPGRCMSDGGGGKGFRGQSKCCAARYYNKRTMGRNSQSSTGAIEVKKNRYAQVSFGERGQCESRKKLSGR